MSLFFLLSRALSKVAMSDVLLSGALSQAVTSDREIAKEFYTQSLVLITQAPVSQGDFTFNDGNLASLGHV